MTQRAVAPDRLQAAQALAAGLVDAWGSWGPTMTADAHRVAFISDRSGRPEAYVQDIALHGEPPEAVRIPLGDDPVLEVHWSADGAWLACLLATGGGVRTQVWVVRPDGTDARRIAGDENVHAVLGPWTRSGHRVVVGYPPPGPGRETAVYLADPTDGRLYPLADGDLIRVLDLSREERLVVMRDGRRGQEFCVVVDRLADQHHLLLPRTHNGATDTVILRPSPEGDDYPLIAYLVTEAGLPRRQLVAVPLGAGVGAGPMRVLAARDDAELEHLDADDGGRLAIVAWNVAGRSELELVDLGTGERFPIEGMPGLVASHPVLSRDGSAAVLAIEGPHRPRELWHVDVATRAWTRVTAVPPLPEAPLVEPTLESFRSHDGLEVTGWLYRAPGRVEPGPGVVHFHGGPESQERPGFSPQHQVLAAAGFDVFTPNIRGSSGFGREFVHADDLDRRVDAFGDMVASADVLADRAGTDRARIAITGRSYGGYLAAVAATFYPRAYAAAVDICGMTDMHTFYRDTEPWIGAAAVTKYGHPRRDRRLLREISPMTRIDDVVAPVLVVHGELDTNVPIGEARQFVAALRKRGRPVEYLELEGEGHEYRRADSRLTLLETMLDFLCRTLG